MQKDKRKICRYFTRGKCVKDDCPFVHQSQTKKPCKFYEEGGYCRKGKNCEFYHATKDQQKKDKKFIEKVSKKHQQQFGKQNNDILLVNDQYIEEKPQTTKYQNQYYQQQLYHNQKKQTSQSQSSSLTTTKIEQSIAITEQSTAVAVAIADELLNLKIKEQLYQQLIKNENEQGNEGNSQQLQEGELNKTHTIQFLKIYPKSFPDLSKLHQTKQFIKNVQIKYFKNVPFLQLINSLNTKGQKQYYQIIRRFQDSFVTVKSVEEEVKEQKQVKKEQVKEQKVQVKEQKQIKEQEKEQEKLKEEKCQQPQQHPNPTTIPTIPSITSFKINLRPLLYQKQISLHFRMIEDRIQLLIINHHLTPTPTTTPKATFKILNESIPLIYKKNFIQQLDNLHSKMSLFDTLKYFQNHFEQIYNKIKFKLENQHFKKIQLKQQIVAQKQKIQKRQKQREQREQEERKQRALLLEYDDNENDVDDVDDDNYVDKQHYALNLKSIKVQQTMGFQQQGKQQQRQQKNQQQIGQQQPQQQQQKIRKQFRDYIQKQFDEFEKPQHQNLNYDITVQSVLMQNCAYLVVEKFLLYIECSCSKNLMYLLDSEERKQMKICVKLQCKKCNNQIRIVWARQVIQHKQTTLSRMSLVNGIILDIGGIGWKIGCNCDEEIIKNKLHLPGQKVQLNCHTCFEQMAIMYMGLKHFNPFVKEFQLQEDKELPLKGACNHDKFNFKWIRYACCGRPFSCDECHKMGSLKKHDKLAGLTMICGYCACEQLIANGNQCSKCKRDLLKGVDKNGHWEGGLGCRDQALLSKKDGKKYAGLTKPNKKKDK